MSNGTRLIWVRRALRLLIVGIFLYAGIIKAIAPSRFIADVHNYHVLPWPMVVALGLYLPWLEIFSALALLMGWVSRGAITILLSLTVIFIVASITAKIRGIDVACGCFGTASRNLSFVNHLLLDALLLAAIIALSLIDTRARAPIVTGQ